MMDWSRWKNFSDKEFACRITQKCNMRPEFLDVLQAIRDDYAKPIFIASGFRDVTHPAEAEKERPGAHTLGLACDIRIAGVEAIKLIELAIKHGIQRIGINQKGQHGGRFIHLDIANQFYAGFPAAIWTY